MSCPRINQSGSAIVLGAYVRISLVDTWSKRLPWAPWLVLLISGPGRKCLQVSCDSDLLWCSIRQAGQSNQRKKTTRKEEYVAMTARPSQACSRPRGGEGDALSSFPVTAHKAPHVLSKWPEGHLVFGKTKMFLWHLSYSWVGLFEETWMEGGPSGRAKQSSTTHSSVQWKSYPRENEFVLAIECL